MFAFGVLRQLSLLHTSSIITEKTDLLFLFVVELGRWVDIPQPCWRARKTHILYMWDDWGWDTSLKGSILDGAVEEHSEFIEEHKGVLKKYQPGCESHCVILAPSKLQKILVCKALVQQQK